MKKVLNIMLLWAAAVAATAQPLVRDTNYAVSAACVDYVKTFGNISNISFFDNRLYFFSSNLLFSAECRNGRLSVADIDTLMLALDPEMNYVVKNPATGNLFFTKRNSKGNSLLYESSINDRGRQVCRQIRFDRQAVTSIIHPVFSRDGQLMVFSASSSFGFGGFDLWYSQLQDGEWQQPRNMGRNVNSVGDEFSPAIWGDFLFFSSNHTSDSLADFDIFCSRLVSLSTIQGDTIVPFPIGRSRVQRLPVPINSDFNDFGIAFDSLGENCFWVSKSQAGGLDHIFTSRGRLDCVAYEGMVQEYGGTERPIPYAHIMVRGVSPSGRSDNEDQILYTCYADSLGRYKLYLQRGNTYKLTFAARNYLSMTDEVVAASSTDEFLNSSWSYTPTLLAFELFVQHPYQGQVLFGSEAGADLVKEGLETLEPLARFLIENPHLKLTITAVYNRSDDDSYCHLLNRARLQSVLHFLAVQGVPAADIESHSLAASFRPTPTAVNTFDNAILFSFTER